MRGTVRRDSSLPLHNPPRSPAGPGARLDAFAFERLIVYGLRVEATGFVSVVFWLLHSITPVAMA